MKISEEIGKTVIGRSSTALMKALVPYFSNTHRLIIIDEADHLTLNALQAIRNLNDEAGIGIVLAGNEKLYMQAQRTMNLTKSEQGFFLSREFPTITQKKRFLIFFPIVIKK